jgi:hypothetical protein
MDDALNHAGLKALAKQLRRPLFTLQVLRNDPFTAGAPARQAGAEWCAELWNRLGIKAGSHLRRIHYVLVSHDEPVQLPNGESYINTEKCAEFLNRASLDARYLGLVPAADLVDRRNDEPIINLVDAEEDGGLIAASGGLLDCEPPGFEIPRLEITPPAILQRYHLEIWIEKSTMDDVLVPLAERYGINLIRGTGEMSHTRCVQFIERAEASSRPVRILYLSDFDPAGASMPVAVARKIEHALHVGGYDLDIQVRPIVLTHDQCVRYRLPRTPIKETETRAAAFEARFGEGATELDALEALNPGELERVLEREIARYYDADLDERINETIDEMRAELHQINTNVHKRHSRAIAALEIERKKVIAEIKGFEKNAKPILRRIEQDLEADAPDADAYDWPGTKMTTRCLIPRATISTRSSDTKSIKASRLRRYLASRAKPFSVVCARCGQSFMATRKDAQFCSNSCRNWRPSRAVR